MLTFSLPRVPAHNREAFPHALPRLHLDLAVRADLHQLRPDLLGDGPGADLDALEVAVLAPQLDRPEGGGGGQERQEQEAHVDGHVSGALSKAGLGPPDLSEAALFP